MRYWIQSRTTHPGHSDISVPLHLGHSRIRHNLLCFSRCWQLLPSKCNVQHMLEMFPGWIEWSCCFYQHRCWFFFSPLQLSPGIPSAFHAVLFQIWYRISIRIWQVLHQLINTWNGRVFWGVISLHWYFWLYFGHFWPFSKDFYVILIHFGRIFLFFL